MPAGSFTVVPAGLSIGTALVADGTVLAGDSVVMSLTAPSRQVTTTAPIGDTTFALGATIDVEFPDGTVQPGTVVERRQRCHQHHRHAGRHADGADHDRRRQHPGDASIRSSRSP